MKKKINRFERFIQNRISKLEFPLYTYLKVFGYCMLLTYFVFDAIWLRYWKNKQEDNTQQITTINNNIQIATIYYCEYLKLKYNKEAPIEHLKEISYIYLKQLEELRLNILKIQPEYFKNKGLINNKPVEISKPLNLNDKNEIISLVNKYKIAFDKGSDFTLKISEDNKKNITNQFEHSYYILLVFNIIGTFLFILGETGPLAKPNK